MTGILPFTYDSQTVRAIQIDGAPWFIQADSLALLDLGRSSAALLDEDEKGVHSLDTPGGVQNVAVISESGFYSLILRSRKPEAKLIRRWITGTVLPEIRRTGSFGAAQPMSRLELLAQAVIAADEMIKEKDQQIAELAPKAEVADRLLTADGDLSVGDAAKALTRAGVKVGPDRLFKALDKRWIYRGADGRWRVYQSAIESGHMSVLPQSHYHPRTGVLVLDPPQPRVTPKGLAKLMREHGVEVADPLEFSPAIGGQS